MFPIRDHNPSGSTPYVTYALIVINVLVFLSYLPLFSEPRELDQFFYKWAMTPQIVTQTGDYTTVATSMFMHGGFMHIAGNMLFLWIFGDNVEDKMGHVGYLIFYLVCGVGAAAVHIMSDPNSPVPTVGASGAIAGVMGSYLLLFPRARVDILFIFIVFFRIFPVPAWAMLALWFGLQLFNGIGTDTEAGGVAYWAHAGGFMLGVLLTIPLFMRLGGDKFWSRTQGRPPHPEAQYRFVRSNVPRVRRRR